MLELLLPWMEECYTRTDSLSLADHRALFDAYDGRRVQLEKPADRWFVEAQPLRWFSAGVLRLAERFEACAVPVKEWTHTAHLSVGLWHIDRYGREDALVRLRSGIRRLNESHGGVNSSTGGYHETITVAYVELLAQFLATFPAGTLFGERVIALLESALASRDMLLQFYSRDLLMSVKARAEWIQPDIRPLLAEVVVGAC